MCCTKRKIDAKHRKICRIFDILKLTETESGELRPGYGAEGARRDLAWRAQRERGGLKCQVQKKWSATDTGRSGQPNTRAGLPLNKTCPTIENKNCLPRYFFLLIIILILSKWLDKVFFHGNHVPVIALSSRCIRQSRALLSLKGQIQKPGKGR